MSKLFLAAAAVAALGFAGQALAADDTAAPSQKVTAANVNFRSQTDVQAFYAKLARTAEAVCDSNSPNSYIQQRDRACVERALANAVQRVNRPLLTAMYRNSATENRGLAQGY